MKKELKDDILVHCLYDWTALASVHGIAMNLFPKEEEINLINLVKSAITSLVEDGLVEVGYITEREFIPFNDMMKTYEKRIDESFKGDEDQFDIWLSNTEKEIN